MVSVNIRLSLIQIATPDHLRGRISAMNGIFISLSNEMGDVRAGSVAALFGRVMAVVMGGVDGDWHCAWWHVGFFQIALFG